MRQVLWSWNRPRRARKWDKISSHCGYWTHRKMKSNHLRNNQHHHCCIVAFIWPTVSISLVSETLTILEGGLSRTPLTCKLESLLLICAITDAHINHRSSLLWIFHGVLISLIPPFTFIQLLRHCGVLQALQLFQLFFNPRKLSSGKKWLGYQWYVHDQKAQYT